MENDQIEKKEFTLVNQQGHEIQKPNRFGVRHVQGLLFFLGVMNSYFLRANVSAGIVPMTNSESNNGAPYYNWDSPTKSLVLSSFFWGYSTMQFLADFLARRYGAKIVYAVAMISGSLLTLLGPLAASIGNWQLFLTSRVFIGFTQGVVYPCTHTLLSKWAPSTERGVFTTGIYSGSQLGTVIILAISGPFFDSAMGWPGLYYISGAIPLIWSLFFLIFGCNEPAQSKIISKEEQHYIEDLTKNPKPKPKNVPFKAIFTSVPFWALIINQFSSNWGFFTLLTEIPNYLSNVLKLDVNSSGLYSALPYLAMFFFSFIVGPISDLLINKQIITVGTARKVFSSIGQWVPMSCLLTMGFLTTENKAVYIALLTICVGFNAASYCGYMINHLDLSRNFTGTLMGIANGFSSIASIVAPLIVGTIVKDESDASQWRIVFFVSATIYLIGNSIFIIFGKASIQPWDSVIEENETDKNPPI